MCMLCVCCLCVQIMFRLFQLFVDICLFLLYADRLPFRACAQGQSALVKIRTIKKPGSRNLGTFLGLGGNPSLKHKNARPPHDCFVDWACCFSRPGCLHRIH